MTQPKVSVLIPVYNVEKYLRECLDSVINQTLTDIEIICVNDGSTDRSSEILQEYAQKDSRIKVIEKAENKGLFLARKTAVSEATGKYLVFLDSDDSLARPDAIHTMISLIEMEDVDILQFSVEAFGDGITRKQGLENWLKVCTDKLEGSVSILQSCMENQYSWNLWNKIYRSEPVKQAYLQIKNIHLVTAEDIYGYFMIACHAKTFKGIETVPLYRYQQGSGVTTGEETLKSFNNYAREIIVTSYLENWFRWHGKLETYQDLLGKLRHRIQLHTVRRFGELPFSDVHEGFQIYRQYYSPSLLLGHYSIWSQAKYHLLVSLGFKRYRQKADFQKKLGLLCKQYQKER